ncbi:MAG: hypothetical protein HY482_01455 [Candidatus Wildermuthbacteria bacterium]|nr:hypothetical protein [Candidatus Wildermuthbacteria bacterium]
MAQHCVLCEKTTNAAWRRVKLRGKYNPTIKRIQKPNLQWTRLSAETAIKAGLIPGARVKACAKCKKALGKN